MKSFIPIGAKDIHDKVRNIIENLRFNNNETKFALDAAAGNGFMSQWLAKNGFVVTALDLNPENWEISEVKCLYSDLNKNINADDQKYDLVVSIETIEHLENPFNFIRELSRVTKKNGIIIITTPNVHSIKSRIKYLFIGSPGLFEYTINDNMGQHISPISIGQLIYAFRESNISLLDVYTVGSKSSYITSLLLSIINIFTLIGAYIYKFNRRSQSDYYLNVLSNKQIKELYRKGLLIIVARKVA